MGTSAPATPDTRRKAGVDIDHECKGACKHHDNILRPDVKVHLYDRGHKPSQNAYKTKPYEGCLQISGHFLFLDVAGRNPITSDTVRMTPFHHEHAITPTISVHSAMPRGSLIHRKSRGVWVGCAFGNRSFHGGRSQPPVCRSAFSSGSYTQKLRVIGIRGRVLLKDQKERRSIKPKTITV